MSLTKQDQHHLQAAVGYIQLGMHNDALDEIKALSGEERDSAVVLALELAILQQSEQWEDAVSVAHRLVGLEPENPDWYVALAYSTRRQDSIHAARNILEEGLRHSPCHALIHYNLGCYAAQLGETEQACDLVHKAFELDPSFRKVAREDPDLEPIRSMLKQGKRKSGKSV